MPYNTAGFYGMGLKQEMFSPGKTFNVSGKVIVDKKFITVTSLKENMNGFICCDVMFQGEKWDATYDPIEDALFLEQGKNETNNRAAR